MIKPTVGRIVWYYPSASDADLVPCGSQPMAAQISCVWSDTCVNLCVTSPSGFTVGRTSVLLVQEGAPRPGTNFCEWMPYQVGQAKAQLMPPFPFISEVQHSTTAAAVAPFSGVAPGPGVYLGGFVQSSVVDPAVALVRTAFGVDPLP